jgi:hypothetical protein
MKADTSEPALYLVDKLLDMKMEGTQKLFLVKWDGFSAKYNTWEPVSNLMDFKDEMAELERSKKEQEEEKAEEAAEEEEEEAEQEAKEDEEEPAEFEPAAATSTGSAGGLQDVSLDVQIDGESPGGWVARWVGKRRPVVTGFLVSIWRRKHCCRPRSPARIPLQRRRCGLWPASQT